MDRIDPPRTSFQLLGKVLQSDFVSDRDYFHIAIPAIPNFACAAKLAGELAHKRTKTHALHTAGDDEVSSRHYTTLTTGGAEGAATLGSVAISSQNSPIDRTDLRNRSYSTGLQT